MEPWFEAHDFMLAGAHGQLSNVRRSTDVPSNMDQKHRGGQGFILRISDTHGAKDKDGWWSACPAVGLSNWINVRSTDAWQMISRRSRCLTVGIDEFSSQHCAARRLNLDNAVESS